MSLLPGLEGSLVRAAGHVVTGHTPRAPPGPVTAPRAWPRLSQGQAQPHESRPHSGQQHREHLPGTLTCHVLPGSLQTHLGVSNITPRTREPALKLQESPSPVLSTEVA